MKLTNTRALIACVAAVFAPLHALADVTVGSIALGPTPDPAENGGHVGVSVRFAESDPHAVTLEVWRRIPSLTTSFSHYASVARPFPASWTDNGISATPTSYEYRFRTRIEGALFSLYGPFTSTYGITTTAQDLDDSDADGYANSVDRCPLLWSATQDASCIALEITAEATRANSDTEHPLPLLATWSTGSHYDDPSDPTTYPPDWQVAHALEGHHFLPTFMQPDRTMMDPAYGSSGSLLWSDYYQSAIQQAAANNLPLSFAGPQWEEDLYRDYSAGWNSLPYGQNPLMWLQANGFGISRVSAFGGTLPWQEIGARWTTPVRSDGGQSMLAAIQAWYPDPPLVLYLSNNEAHREQPVPGCIADDASDDVEQDQYFLDAWGAGQSKEFKRAKLAEGWITRYRLMQSGMRDNLTQSSWRNNIRFIGYGALGPDGFGRWSHWARCSLHTIGGPLDPNPMMWDGASVNQYIGNGHRYPWDSQVWSPEVEAMNLVFMLSAAQDLNPDFWFELSTWNGCDYYPLTSAPPSDTSCSHMIETTPGYTPSRYAGAIQFGMWLLRPRVVRDFRSHGAPVSSSLPYLDALQAAVDKIYTNGTLRKFWRQSRLVANPSRAHPYQSNIPPEYAGATRMFLLTTSFDPALPWSMNTPLPVFSMARVRGTVPTRQWLVYAFSPDQDRSAVEITLPGYTAVRVPATIAGAFSLVVEGGPILNAETGLPWRESSRPPDPSR